HPGQLLRQGGRRHVRVPHGALAEAGQDVGDGVQVERGGAGEVVVGAGGVRERQGGQGAADVGAGDGGHPARARGHAQLAGAQGGPQERGEELGEQRGARERVPAAGRGQEPFGPAVGVRVAERGGEVGVDTAEVDHVPDAGAAGGPDDVLVVHHHAGGLAVAGDEHQDVDVAQRGGQGRRVVVVGVAGDHGYGARRVRDGLRTTGQGDYLVHGLAGRVG